MQFNLNKMLCFPEIAACGDSEVLTEKKLIKVQEETFLEPGRLKCAT